VSNLLHVGAYRAILSVLFGFRCSPADEAELIRAGLGERSAAGSLVFTSEGGCFVAVMAENHKWRRRAESGAFAAGKARAA
jgi:hypothetical protein